MKFELLTVGNPKTEKGETQGYLTFILHLAPAKVSGKEMCPDRSPACTFLCLNTAGRGGIFKKGEKTNTIQKARIRKALFFLNNRAEFMRALIRDIRKAIRYAKKLRLIPVFRLNGTSDIQWENISVENFANVYEMFPDVQFYDYTKTIGRKIPANVMHVFSRSEKNSAQVSIAMAQGLNIAVIFRKTLPETFLGRPVINGDLSDLRFKDPRGVIVGLKAKGRAKKDKSGMVVDVDANGIAINTRKGVSHVA